MTRRLLTCIFSSFLVGCANPGIVQLSGDTYMLARTDKAGIFGNPSSLKAEVIRDAQSFAASQGKIAIPVASNEIPLQVGRSFASYEYQFKLVDPGSREATEGGRFKPEPIATTSEIKVVDQKAKKDLHAELIKLDDLRKRGLLSDAEFDMQKRKLLSE